MLIKLPTVKTIFMVFSIMASIILTIDKYEAAIMKHDNVEIKV